MKCTPYMIYLFLISECVALAKPKGDSVLKSIQAAFVWGFELLCVCLCPWSTVLHKNIVKSDADSYYHDTRWSYDEALPEAQAAWGCPTKSGIVEQTCMAIKNIIALCKAPQRHACATSKAVHELTCKSLRLVFPWFVTQIDLFPWFRVEFMIFVSDSHDLGWLALGIRPIPAFGHGPNA